MSFIPCLPASTLPQTPPRCPCPAPRLRTSSRWWWWRPSRRCASSSRRSARRPHGCCWGCRAGASAYGQRAPLRCSHSCGPAAPACPAQAFCPAAFTPTPLPQKYRGLMNFLSTVLREDGGFEYKKARAGAAAGWGGWVLDPEYPGAAGRAAAGCQGPSPSLSLAASRPLPPAPALPLTRGPPSSPPPPPKQAIVDSILVLIREIPEAKEMGLAQLCEFIEVGRGGAKGQGGGRKAGAGGRGGAAAAASLAEAWWAPVLGAEGTPCLRARLLNSRQATPPPQDCEFTFLSVQILHVLGDEGPATKDPGAPPGWVGGGGRRAGASRGVGAAEGEEAFCPVATCTSPACQSHHPCPPRCSALHPLHLQPRDPGERDGGGPAAAGAAAAGLPVAQPWPGCRGWSALRQGAVSARSGRRRSRALCCARVLQVRAAALSALARFGAACPELRDRVLLLLKRALHDNDDEVRRQPAEGSRAARGEQEGRAGWATFQRTSRAGAMVHVWSAWWAGPAPRLARSLPPPPTPLAALLPNNCRRCATAPRSTCTSCSGRRRAPAAWTRTGASRRARWTRRCRPTWRSPTPSSPLTW